MLLVWYPLSGQESARLVGAFGPCIDRIRLSSFRWLLHFIDQLLLGIGRNTLDKQSHAQSPQKVLCLKVMYSN